MSNYEQRVFQEILSLFADVREQEAAFYRLPYSPKDIHRMKIQWQASSEANKRISKGTTLQSANKK